MNSSTFSASTDFATICAAPSAMRIRSLLALFMYRLTLIHAITTTSRMASAPSMSKSLCRVRVRLSSLISSPCTSSCSSSSGFWGRRFEIQSAAATEISLSAKLKAISDSVNDSISPAPVYSEIMTASFVNRESSGTSFKTHSIKDPKVPLTSASTRANRRIPPFRFSTPLENIHTEHITTRMLTIA